MQTSLILLSSLTISSLLWIVPLLLMGNHIVYEETCDTQKDKSEEYFFIQEHVTMDSYDDGTESQTLYAFDVVDEMISVAFANKIVSKKVSADFAFSIN